MRKLELHLQTECFQWAWNYLPQTRRLLFAVPNGGKRNKIEATQLKASGVVAGIPDLVLVWAGRAYGFELKSPKGVTSDAQIEVHSAWADQRATVYLIRDLEEFKFRLSVIVNGSAPA